MTQSEITKESQAGTLELEKDESASVIVFGPTHVVRGNDEMYTRLTSLNRCLAHCCSEQGFGFVWFCSFWVRPDLLKAFTLLTGIVAAVLSRNIDRCLCQV